MSPGTTMERVYSELKAQISDNVNVVADYTPVFRL